MRFRQSMAFWLHNKPQSTTFHFASPNGQPQLNCRDANDVRKTHQHQPIQTMHTMDLAVKRNSATLKEPPHYVVSASINATFSTLGLANQCRATCAGRPNNPQQRTQTKIPWLIIMSPVSQCPYALYTHIHICTYDGLSKCLFPVLLINRNSMRAASCLPLKNMTYLDDVQTWKFFVAFGNLSKTTGIS